MCGFFPGQKRYNKSLQAMAWLCQNNNVSEILLFFSLVYSVALWQKSYQKQVTKNTTITGP